MKRAFPLFLFSLLMLLDVAAFLMQKRASNAVGTTNDAYLSSIVTHPWAWLALAVAPLQLWTWTRILARADISFVYPLTSISVPLTMLASILFFGEHAQWQVWLGVALITAGASVLNATQPEPH